jgi:hypothetical protein
MGFGRIIRFTGLACALGLALAAPADASSGGDQWTSAGGDRTNARFQASQHEISPTTAGELDVDWMARAPSAGTISAWRPRASWASNTRAWATRRSSSRRSASWRAQLRWANSS